MSETLADRLEALRNEHILAFSEEEHRTFHEVLAALRAQEPSEPVSTFTIVSGAQMFFSTPHLGHLPAGEYAVFALATEEGDE